MCTSFIQLSCLLCLTTETKQLYPWYKSSPKLLASRIAQNCLACLALYLDSHLSSVHSLVARLQIMLVHYSFACFCPADRLFSHSSITNHFSMFSSVFSPQILFLTHVNSNSIGVSSSIFRSVSLSQPLSSYSSRLHPWGLILQSARLGTSCDRLHGWTSLARR